MKQYNILKYCFIIVISAIFAVGCVDDDLYNPADYGDGVANVTAQMTFDCYTEALNQSRSAGTSLDDITSLQILVYDLEGQIVRTNYYTSSQFKTETVSAPKYEYDAETGQNVLVGEENTKRAILDFNNQLAYGRYYIYAVANVGHNIPSDSVATRELLRNYPLVWYPTITKNGQMLGTFSEEPQGSYNNETTVDINKPNQTIYAWVRRAASKVTVAYDASNLDDNVFVYIHSVRIHDIPKRSTLGGKYSVTKSSDLIKTGEILYYDNQGNITSKASNWGTSTTEKKDDPSIVHGDVTSADRINIKTASKNWFTLANGKSTGGAVKHAANDQSLFFYENLQGNHTDDPLFDKRQYAKEEGSMIVKDKDWTKNDVSDNSDWKDRVPYGTWIEVRGYYENRDLKNLSSGPIIYRFMLGKDEKFDYDCERNHHYKLTLKFNGQANNVDWHIDYKEETPSLILPEGSHVSYYYSQKAFLPVKARVPEGATDIEIRADILENNWRPVKYNDPTWKNDKNQDLYDNLRKSTNKNTSVTSKLTDYVTGSTICKKYNAFGFLSLRDVKETATINADNGIKDIDNVVNWFNNGKCGWQQYKLGTSLPKPGETKTLTTNSASFICTANKDDLGTSYTYTFQIPVYTQPRVLGGWAVFSGANQFEWSEREATVRVTLTYKINGVTQPALTGDVTILQDPKVINPMGIWRRSTNTHPFNVVLKVRDSAEGDFSPLVSDGPWKAYVYSGDKSLVKLSALGESKKYGDTIRGKTRSIIEFKYTPVGTSESQPRFAVIKVEFHNSTSFHYIFVRQGYQDVKVGSTTWSTFNLYKDGERCASPLSIGSYFRRGNIGQGITEYTNRKYGVGVKPTNVWVNGADADHKSTWSQVTFNDIADWKIGNGYQVPTQADAAALIDDLTALFGYGIVYADGASEAADKASDAFGFYDRYNTITSSTKGVRGVMYSNQSNGAQVFFPIGETGHGRRDKGTADNATPLIRFSKGELRYAGVSTALTLSATSANWYRPLAYDTYDQPGAIYWLRGSSTSKYGIDINFRVWRFNYYGKDLLYNSTYGYDACPLKPVK